MGCLGDACFHEAVTLTVGSELAGHLLQCIREQLTQVPWKERQWISTDAPLEGSRGPPCLASLPPWERHSTRVTVGLSPHPLLTQRKGVKTMQEGFGRRN